MGIDIQYRTSVDLIQAFFSQGFPRTALVLLTSRAKCDLVVTLLRPCNYRLKRHINNIRAIIRRTTATMN